MLLSVETPLGSGRTLVQQSETFTGLLIPVAGSLLRHTQAGFVAMNDALAERVTQPSTPAIDVLRAAKRAGADAALSGPA